MQRAAKESKEELENALRGADLVVVTVRPYIHAQPLLLPYILKLLGGIKECIRPQHSHSHTGLNDLPIM